MQIYQSLTPIHAPQGSAVALGYFDGVHCGHRAVLGAAVECARAGGLTAAAFTFELPASSTLKGGRILSLPQKHARVASLGIEEYQEAPFDEFRALTPEDFVQKVLVDCFNAKQLFCGDNFTFGARAAGNVERLRELCAPLGIGVHIVPMAQYGGQTVSSTRIRAALEEGRLDDANAMLGTPYAIDWPVVRGKGIGSGKLGTPTLNQNYPAAALVRGSPSARYAEAWHRSQVYLVMFVVRAIDVPFSFRLCAGRCVLEGWCCIPSKCRRRWFPDLLWRWSSRGSRPGGRR